MNEFAKQLKNHRTRIALTQEGLAKKLFVTRQAVSKWEAGESTPDLDILIKLTDIFNISLDTLVFGNKANSKVDDSEFVWDPTTHEYSRRYGKMNFWDYMSENWWIIIIIGVIVTNVAIFLH